MIKKLLAVTLITNIAAISAFSCPDRLFSVQGTKISINDRTAVFEASPGNVKSIYFPKGEVSEVNLGAVEV